jgi:hypothetical protein
MKGRLQGKHWRKQEGDTVLQGICIDIGETTVLEKGKTYFLFPNGSTHYYVSKFQNKNSHFGCFRKSFFQIVQKDEWSPEPPADNVPSLDSSKIYEAILIWREKGYHATIGSTYYLRPRGTHATFYHDRNLKRLGGCFPLHWFTDFREINKEDTETNETIVEAKVPKYETEEEIPASYKQTTIFDFLE